MARQLMEHASRQAAFWSQGRSGLQLPLAYLWCARCESTEARKPGRRLGAQTWRTGGWWRTPAAARALRYSGPALLVESAPSRVARIRRRFTTRRVPPFRVWRRVFASLRAPAGRGRDDGAAGPGAGTQPVVVDDLSPTTVVHSWWRCRGRGLPRRSQGVELTPELLARDAVRGSELLASRVAPCVATCAEAGHSRVVRQAPVTSACR